MNTLFESIYVVSLPFSHERRKNVHTQMSKMRCSFEFYEAYDGLKINRKALIRQGKLVAKPDGQYLTLGELGCLMSHRRVWNEVQGPTLIFEDDFGVIPRAANIFKSVMREVPSDWDIIHFHSRWAPDSTEGPGASRKSLSKHVMRAGISEGGGSVCYAITPKCAAWLVTLATPTVYPTDGVTNWPSGDWVECAGWNAYVARPFPIKLLPFDSEIRSRT